MPMQNMSDLIKQINHIINRNTKNRENNPYSNEIIEILKTFNTETKNFDEVIKKIKNLSDCVWSDKNNINLSRFMPILETFSTTLECLKNQKKSKKIAKDWNKIYDYVIVDIDSNDNKLPEQVPSECLEQEVVDKPENSNQETEAEYDLTNPFADVQYGEFSNLLPEPPQPDEMTHLLRANDSEPNTKCCGTTKCTLL